MYFFNKFKQKILVECIDEICQFNDFLIIADFFVINKSSNMKWQGKSQSRADGDYPFQGRIGLQINPGKPLNLKNLIWQSNC